MMSTYFGSSVRRQSHHLVFTGVHLEAGVVGERRVEQSERVWPVNLVENLEVVAAADAN